MRHHFLGIIPARYASTRFPGKPLAKLGDKPMIQWVWERASASFGHLIVATDDHRIYEAVESFGGKAVMTSADHRTGTERCAEALDLYITSTGVAITHVVNIQGDEPFLQPSQLEALKACLLETGTEVATLVQPISNPADLDNPNVVKVITGSGSRALYFSRLPVPYSRDADPVLLVSRGLYLRHIGLYGYRAEVLRELVRLPVSPLEQAESLEQLRWLDNGIVILTRTTTESSMGVDTPEDLEVLRQKI
jgi:3-deoxy-manno-octulosonate cytidylyltransferase (CMP-KDO synthetase)